MYKKPVVELNSLGKAQANLEYAARELRAAHTQYESAVTRLSLANEGHDMASTALIAEVGAVRGKAKVLPPHLR